MDDNIRFRGKNSTKTEELFPGHPELVLSGKYLPYQFREQSQLIAKDIVKYVCAPDDSQMAPNRACQIMRSLVKDTINVSHDMFADLSASLNLSSLDQISLLHEVTTEMFADQKVTWGRVVTIHAFCAFLARYCESGALPGAAEKIALTLEDITINRLGLWIVAAGGWQTFDQQFPSVCWMEYGGMWKGLMVTLMLLAVIMFFFIVIRYFF